MVFLFNSLKRVYDKRGKGIPLFALCFFLSFHYYILKTLKDTIVITAVNSGAETIPFIKVWLLIPVSLFMIGLFTWLTNRYTLKTVFYISNIFFILFFLFFTFFLYPLRNQIHMESWADKLQLLLPFGWRGFVAIFRNWSFSLFYVIAECWPPIVYGLFWALANEVTNLIEATRLYPLLMFFGNLSAIFAGHASQLFTNLDYHPYIPFGNTAWDQSIAFLTCTMLASSLIVLAIFHKHFTLNLNTTSSKEAIASNSGKKQIPFIDSLKLLAKSKHLFAIALVVFSFNMITNLVDVVWKDQINKLYPDPSEYHSYMSYMTSIVGWLSAFLTLFVCTSSLYFFGWTFTAMITPILTLVTGICFFSFLLLKDFQQSDFLGLAQTFAISPLALSGLLGSIHICFTRSSKYSLLDPAKEMAFIPLPTEQKLQGKATIDGIFSHLGKASSSLIFQALLFLLPSISACTPYVISVFLIALMICILSIFFLGRLIHPDISTQKRYLLKS